MIQNGNLIRLYLDGSIIGKLTALDVTYEREMLDSTDKYSDGWKTVEPGNKSFSISAEGFYVNPSGKNLIPFSENFANARWTKSGFTLSSTLVNDPFGFKRAYRTVGLASGESLIIQLDTGTDYDTPTENLINANGGTFSMWVKTVTGTSSVEITFEDVGTTANIETFAINTTWQRISVSNTDVAMDASVVTLILQSAGSGEIEIFGAQFEVGTSVTFYEPTGLKFTNLFDSVDNGTKMTAVITDSITGNTEYEGDVYVNNLSLSTPQGQLSTFSCEITGTNAITTI